LRKTGFLLALTVATALLASAGVALAASNIGYRDFSFAASGVGAPTPMMAQSKLWFNDGVWWGVLFDRSTEEYHVYRYDWATHTWNDTGTLVDERNFSKADALWDGTHLYVVSAGPNSANSAHSARISRYTYVAATRSYALDPGFPVTITNGGMKAIVLDKDSTGKLWVTYAQQNQVYVNRSLGDDSIWGRPFVPLVKGTSVTSDDISAMVAYDLRTAAPKIGVMWSNQADDAMYFATHRDGDPDEAWQESRTVIQGPKQADDHINLKALPADSSGRVFAAVKTSLDDLTNPNPNDPQILLLVLGQDGEWTSHVFGTVGDRHSRPIVMLDEERRDLYMFATAPTGGGTIYYKQTDLDNISFPSGKGTPFIQSTTDTHIDDATSTKQNLNSATGLMVLASDSTSKYYLHNTTPPPQPPPDDDTTAPRVISTVPTANATGVAPTTNVTATFSEDMLASSINGQTFKLFKKGSTTKLAAAVSYEARTNTATLDPTNSLQRGLTYKAVVTTGAKDLAGNSLDQNSTSTGLQQHKWFFTVSN
jgi:hypothetical protein